MSQTILLVEDDKLLGEALVHVLEEEGYQVFWAKDSSQAIEVIEHQNLDLIYIDIMLPGNEDGFDLLKNIRGRSNLKQTPVIMLTNLGQISDIERANELGATDYFIKANIDLNKLAQLTNEKIRNS